MSGTEPTPRTSIGYGSGPYGLGPYVAQVLTATLAIQQAPQTLVAAGGAVVTGNLGVIEGADILAAAGGAVVRGTLGVTEALDTLAATGGASLTGTLTIQEAPDTITAAASVAAGATLALTEIADALAAAASTSVRATLGVLEAPDTIAATGSVLSGIGGSLIITQAAQTIAATGTVRVAATLALTEAADTLDATGTVPIAATTGTLAITEAPDTLNAAGLVLSGIVGSLSITQDNQTLDATAYPSWISPSFCLTGTWATPIPCETGTWATPGTIGYGRKVYGMGPFGRTVSVTIPLPVWLLQDADDGTWIPPDTDCETGTWTQGVPGGYGIHAYGIGPFGRIAVAAPSWQTTPTDPVQGDWILAPAPANPPWVAPEVCGVSTWKQAPASGGYSVGPYGIGPFGRLKVRNTWQPMPKCGTGNWSNKRLAA